MSSTICILPIIAALVTANNFVDLKDVSWQTINAEQKTFVENYWPNRADLDLLKDGKMQCKASNDASVVNQFLKDNNFKIQLTDLHNPLAFYAASILKIALEWEKEGTKTTLKMEHYDAKGCKEYPAVKFAKNDGQDFKVYNIRMEYWPSNHTLPQILEIKAKNGDLVYMMRDSVAFSGYHSYLEAIINELQKNITPENEVHYDEVLFPMVDIDQEVDIKWLEGLNAYDGSKKIYEIAQALQQTKFQMNEKGAKVESAVAISCVATECAPRPKKVFTINKPFYLWIIRPGIKIPIFAAYIDMDAWKAPAEAAVDQKLEEPKN